MQSEIRTFSYPNGEIQRVQIVRWIDWRQLDFLQPQPSDNALESFERIYRKFLVPGCPWIFGNLVLFRLPTDLAEELFSKRGSEDNEDRYGVMDDPLTMAAAVLRHGVKFVGKRPVFLNSRAKRLYDELQRRQCLYVVRGKLPTTWIIPVSDHAGMLSATETMASMKVNASFFIMDRFDCATVYDHVGVPFGLCVKNGVVESPPLYQREALLVGMDGRVRVEAVDLRTMEIEIGDVSYEHGKNAVLYTRPDRKETPASDSGQKIVIVGCRVVAVKETGGVPIPASGFVLSLKVPAEIQPGDLVTYRGMEKIRFGIQVGNSILRDGVKTKTFLSRFYHIRKLEPIPYPPSLYPMDFAKARAARIALGADADGNPMLVWAEGAPKIGYVPGQHSCGASLLEMAEFCSQVGMAQAINLDGGGSAQILLSNHRFLQISDRRENDHAEAERPVPLGLIIRG